MAMPSIVYAIAFDFPLKNLSKKLSFDIYSKKDLKIFKSLQINVIVELEAAVVRDW